MATTRSLCLAFLVLAFPSHAAAEDISEAIRAYLHYCVEAQWVNAGVVVGLVDEHGSLIVACGKLDNGSNQEIKGETVFEIGSVTKTFTGLLLQDMVQRGEMALDEPVATYLPAAVKVPSRNGKPITLRHLATHTSGLPPEPDNLDPKRAEYPCDGYTVEKLYAFLSDYQLTRDPGTKFEYSSAGIALLAQAIALRAGTSYESLVVDRICQPLGMVSTRVTLTPKLRARLAVGHSPAGFVVPTFDSGPLAPACGLRSTASDMIKYVSANLGLTPSGLTPLMYKTHEIQIRHATSDADIGLVWVTSRDPQGTEVIWHNGALYGCVSFVGFDKARRRGVVVLANSRGFIDAGGLGKFLLSSEWHSDRRPSEAVTRGHANGLYVGQYRPRPVATPRRGWMHQLLGRVSKAAFYVPAGFCLAVLAVLLRRAARHRRRWVMLGGAILASGLVALVLVLVPDGAVDQMPRAGIGIRSDRGRLFAQATGARSWPVETLLPPIAGELLSESETRLFERLSGTPVDVSRNERGEVTGLTLHHLGRAFSYAKVSDEPPAAPEPPKRPVVVKLEAKLLDACVGHYDISPDAESPAGAKLAVWRDGDHLVGQLSGKGATRGAIDIYPESETQFVLTIDGSRLTFVKNDQGQVTDVIHHCPEVPDHRGKKMRD